MPLPQRCRWNAPRKPMNCSSRARSSGTSSWSPDLIYGMGMADYRLLMKTLGIDRAKGRWTNWSWEPNERDRVVMSDLLYKGKNAIGLRRRPSDIAGWPEVQRELAATALAAHERRLYEASWREFRREFGLAGGSTRRPAG